MTSALASLPESLRRIWRWQRGADPEADHGHRPYAAWEAELTAYARLRTGAPLKVEFALATEALWTETLRLGRPPARRSVQDAFADAELELEHLIAHHRHGCRELALFWQAWARPTDRVRLPWPPWDHVELPGGMLLEPLAQAVPGLQPGDRKSGWPPRLREAARWISSAWSDGAHRAAEIAERPGLADRLPLPSPPARATPWVALLHTLHCGAQRSSVAVIERALSTLSASDVSYPAMHVRATLEAVETLAQRGLLPPAHKQRPPWLRPAWGRWRRAAALRAALDAVARSPATAEIASLTAAARARGSTLAGGGHSPGGLSRTMGAAGLTGRRAAKPSAEDAAEQATEVDQQLQDPNAWGVPTERDLPIEQGTPAAATSGDGREGSGLVGLGGTGAGAGALGALHVITPSASDRAAYWQLRGALAPDIERLIERLRAATDDYYANVPRRFQRVGRLDRSRLAAAAAGREAVFIRHVHQPKPAHALCLLLDCSASMTTHADLLRESAILMESAAAAVGAHVAAFTFGASWERIEPPVRGAPLVTLGRELHPHGGTPFGPAVAAAEEWLAHQPYDQKRLWVFSDGQWSARDRMEVARKAATDVVIWIFNDVAPEALHPGMRVVAAPSLADLVDQAPRYFWVKPP